MLLSKIHPLRIYNVRHVLHLLRPQHQYVAVLPQIPTQKRLQFCRASVLAVYTPHYQICITLLLPEHNTFLLLHASGRLARSCLILPESKELTCLVLIRKSFFAN